MELYIVFFWLEMVAFAIQMGFIIGGIIKKDINLSVVYCCFFLVLIFLAGYWITKP